MERKISYDDLKKAVDEAYEQFKSNKDGAVDSRLEGVDADAFGISVVLTDGRRVDKADTDVLFPLGGIVKLPVDAVLLSQNNMDAIVKKSGACHCDKHTKPEIPFSAHGIRYVSAVEPTGDADGKYDIISDMFLAMAGAPVLNDALYEAYQTELGQESVAEKLVDAHYRLYDDAKLSAKTYVKLLALQYNTKQLATLGATIAADGRNPFTGVPAFDGTISAPLTALMAAGKMHHCRKAWLVRVGLPAKSSFAGAILAVLPGFGAIAVYAPRVDEQKLSVKGAQALQYIANKLGLNVFASARVTVDK